MNQILTNHFVQLLCSHLSDITGEKVTAKFDWRYSNTLRINFNKGVGIGIHGDEEDIEEFVDMIDDDDKKYLTNFDDINNEIDKTFKGLVEIDWRDEKEVELHMEEFNNNCSVFLTKGTGGSESWFVAPTKLVGLDVGGKLHHEDDYTTYRMTHDMSNYECQEYIDRDCMSYYQTA